MYADLNGRRMGAAQPSATLAYPHFHGVLEGCPMDTLLQDFRARRTPQDCHGQWVYQFQVGEM